jgi:hypothetical protein
MKGKLIRLEKSKPRLVENCNNYQCIFDGHTKIHVVSAVSLYYHASNYFSK